MQEKKETKPATQAAKAEVKEAAKAATETVGAKAKEVKTATKTTAKKATAKKPGRKPAAKKTETEIKMMVQFGGWEVDMAAVQEKIKAKFVAEGHRAGAIKKLEIYVKPEEKMAYYVINDGKFGDGVELF